MGTHPTHAVLFKGDKRVKVQPNEIVESDVKLGGNFMPFDENILDEMERKIKTQKSYVESAVESKDIAVKELKSKHEAEMNALVEEHDAKIKSLDERVSVFVGQKKDISDNISKAQTLIQDKIDRLTASAKKISEVSWEKKAKK